jgi:hypothetical protein
MSGGSFGYLYSKTSQAEQIVKSDYMSKMRSAMYKRGLINAEDTFQQIVSLIDAQNIIIERLNKEIADKWESIVPIMKQIEWENQRR